MRSRAPCNAQPAMRVIPRRWSGVPAPGAAPARVRSNWAHRCWCSVKPLLSQRNPHSEEPEAPATHVGRPDRNCLVVVVVERLMVEPALVDASVRPVPVAIPAARRWGAVPAARRGALTGGSPVVGITLRRRTIEVMLRGSTWAVVLGPGA